MKSFSQSLRNSWTLSGDSSRTPSTSPSFTSMVKKRPQSRRLLTSAEKVETAVVHHCLKVWNHNVKYHILLNHHYNPNISSALLELLHTVFLLVAHATLEPFSAATRLPWDSWLQLPCQRPTQGPNGPWIRCPWSIFGLEPSFRKEDCQLNRENKKCIS